MKVIANGLEISAGELASINSADLEGVEILTSASNTTIFDAAGVIILTFKRGTAEIPPPAYLNRINLKGYADAREFYSPNYQEQPGNRKVSDLRSTVYWNPNVVTDGEGKATFSFFTNDEPGVFRVIIEGLDVDGRLARHFFTYNAE